MINNTVLVGRLTKDIDLRYTSSNIAYAKFTVAVNRTYAEANGERKADFITCIAWRNQAENMAKYVGKGSLIGIEGRIQTGQYEKDGITHYTTDIVCNSVQFLESKQQSTEQNQVYNDIHKDKPSVEDNTQLPF